jgi:hypothetical protein
MAAGEAVWAPCEPERLTKTTRGLPGICAGGLSVFLG